MNRHCWFGLLLVLTTPGVAGAQTSASPGRVEVGGGVRWVGGATLGEMDATLGTASGGSFVQFASASELGATVAFEGRVGVRLTRSLQAEAGISYGTTELQTRLDSDVEGIPDTTVSESLGRYTIEGALVASLAGWRLGAAVPFVTVGGGGGPGQRHHGSGGERIGVALVGVNSSGGYSDAGGHGPRCRRWRITWPGR